MDKNQPFTPSPTPLLRLGRYQIVAELGEGAMGKVYEAHDPTLERSVALKTVRLRGLLAGSEEFLRRFRAEAKAAGRLSHPNIVTIYDFGQADDTAYIAMELLLGQTLRQILDQQRLSVRRAMRYAMQIADGLAAAHALDVVHRDIKPGNIVRLHNGLLKITDFGIAQAPTNHTTLTGTLLGTPRYMSPEQVSGAKTDARTDVFSLGVVLYEMLTNQVPFDGPSLSAIMYKIVHDPAADPRSLNPKVSAGLTALLARCLAKDPAERFSSMTEVSRHLRALSENQAVPLALPATFLPWHASASAPDTDAQPGRNPGAADRTLPLGTRLDPKVGGPLRVSWRRLGASPPAKGFAVLAGGVLVAVLFAWPRWFAPGRMNAVAAPPATLPSTAAESPAASVPAAGADPNPATVGSLTPATAQIPTPTPTQTQTTIEEPLPASDHSAAAPLAAYTPLPHADAKPSAGHPGTNHKKSLPLAVTTPVAAPAREMQPIAPVEPSVSAAPEAPVNKKPTLQEELKRQRECLLLNRCDQP